MPPSPPRKHRAEDGLSGQPPAKRLHPDPIITSDKGDAMDVDIDSACAWVAKKDEIDAFLVEALDDSPAMADRRTRGAYVQSAFGSGKSTSLLAHVYDVASKAQTGPIIYLLPRIQEVLHLYEYLKSDQHNWSNSDEIRREVMVLGQGESTTRLVLCSFEDHVHLGGLPGQKVILVDIEVRATMIGELCFATLIELAQRGQDAIRAMICLAARVSRRTMSAFERHGLARCRKSTGVPA